jgi:hypothetical protein
LLIRSYDHVLPEFYLLNQRSFVIPKDYFLFTGNTETFHEY